jgi:ADP-ribosylglycohydrolase
MSDQISSEDRRQRIRASALWAAYGDALGFISELTDRNGVRRRANVDHLSTTVAWTRRIGGQFGPTVTLPAGTVSDDTQLRLATSRSIRPNGAFDVETFSEIELTSWPAYALGAGRGSRAAAANLRKRDVTWATNFFDAKSTKYVNGGGNGAAMRVQPHVWAAPEDAPPYSWLADVIVNSITTHGHERGFVGAAFHAACVSLALAERRVPGPDDWPRLLVELGRLPTVIREDDRLSEIWLRLWEKRTERALEAAVKTVIEELAADIRPLATVSVGQGRSAYVDAVESIRAYEPAQRGSGTKTSVLAALVAWLYAEQPADGLSATANFLGTDTDSIATMAGAILGAAGAGGAEIPGEVQDHDYIVREADRSWAAASARRPPAFPYPDVLGWRPPRTGADVVVADSEQLHVVGLGPAVAAGKPYFTGGKTPGVWQWVELWYGQTLIAKRRERPPKLAASHRVEPSTTYVQTTLAERPAEPSDPARNEPSARARPSGPEPRIEDRRRRPLPPRQPQRRERTLDEITDDVIRAGLTDSAIGAGLREVAGHAEGVEGGLGFAAIIVKALATRARQHRMTRQDVEN